MWFFNGNDNLKVVAATTDDALHRLEAFDGLHTCLWWSGVRAGVCLCVRRCWTVQYRTTSRDRAAAEQRPRACTVHVFGVYLDGAKL